MRYSFLLLLMLTGCVSTEQHKSLNEAFESYVKSTKDDVLANKTGAVLKATEGLIRDAETCISSHRKLYE